MNNTTKNLLINKYKEATKVVFFGGAGVSTKSGIPDFRSPTGLYKVKSEYGVSYETILSHSYYAYNTKIFFDFYKKHMIYKDAKPNKAHKILTELQKQKDITIVTQNIDGLHAMAGNKKVIELHGSINRNYCEKCHTFFDLDYILESKGVPKCSHCGGTVKPDVVLYEEGLNERDIYAAIEAIRNADLIIVAGTSLNVYPAAQFIQYRKQSATLAIVNLESTPYDMYADIVIHEDIGEVLESLIK